MSAEKEAGVILIVHLVLDPVVQSLFSGEVPGVSVGLLLNSAKSEGSCVENFLSGEAVSDVF